MSDDWEEGSGVPVDSGSGGWSSGGFGSGDDNGFGSKGGFGDSDGSGFGGGRGRRGGFGGGGGGFGRQSNDDSSDQNRFHNKSGGGFGNDGGRAGGFGWGFSSRDEDSSDHNGLDDSGSGGGFRDRRGRRGGFGGGRGGGRFGRRNDSSDQNGFDDSGSGGGFGGGRGRRGGFGGGRGGGGFGRRDDDSSDQSGFDSGSGGGFGGGCGRRGGFARGGGRGGFGRSDDGESDKTDSSRRGFRRGGGGFSGGMDGDDAGGQGGGFRENRGRRSSSDRDGETFDNDNFGGEEKPQRVTYIPPAPPEEEKEIFHTIQQGINFDNYDSIPVEMTGRDPIKPITSFEEASLYDTFKENVKKVAYVKPTPVQKYSIPAILAGRDLMACAQTGSGKTAAFVLPVMTGMINIGLVGGSAGPVQTPQALVVAPTRELALQIYLEAYKFSHGTMITPCVCYGGVAVGHQLRMIEKGCHFLVATPGRLLDFIKRGKVSLECLKYLILDEADRMLDMGFESAIRQLSENPSLPPKAERQTLMFSATFPEEIQRLAGEFLNDYLFLTVGRVGGTTSDIDQVVVQVSEYEKRERLVELLSNAGTDRFLVFVETKRSADFLASYLSQTGFPTTSIHGDRQQREREEALEDFKKGRTPVMVATSVAARGLDIPDVKHVINYDLPKEIEEYVHRIGRTGRIGHKGKATSFFQSDRDSAIARSLVKVLGDAEQEVPDWLEEQAENAFGTNYGPAGGRFGSRDTRKFKRGGSNDFGGNDFGGNDDVGWGVDAAADGGGDEEWTSSATGGDESWD